MTHQQNSQSSVLSPRHSLLITGGAGFIGANFVHYWLQHNPATRVVVLDALTYAGNMANLDSVRERDNFRFVHGDIRNYELVVELLQSERIDTIVHFAAESHVDRSILGPDEFIAANVVGTHALLKAARTVWLDPKSSVLSTQHSHFRFHHVSTDEVYGSLGPNDPPFTETTPYAPNSPYAASKAGSDHLVRAYHHTYGLPVTISNCSNNYGPYQFPEKLIPLLIINCLQGKPLPIYGDGRNIRDWLYVEDHCRGIELVLKKGRNGEVYNIGGNCEKTNLEIVNTVCAVMDELRPRGPQSSARSPQSSALSAQSSVLSPVSHSSLIEFVKDRPGHDRRYAIDSSKIRNELGFSPRESFDSGIRLTIEWYLENEGWWRAVMDGRYREWIARQYDRK